MPWTTCRPPRCTALGWRWRALPSCRRRPVRRQLPADPVKGKHFQSVKIAAEIAAADSLIVVSHFKGHLPAGFSGAIKNLGMGCAPAAGKAEQHSAKPIFNADICSGCGSCRDGCPKRAITVQKKISAIDYEEMHGMRQVPARLPNACHGLRLACGRPALHGEDR